MRVKALLSFVAIFFATLVLADVTIKDVSPLIPEHDAVIYMVSNGIMETEDGFFKGGKIITKFDLAVYLYRLIKFLKLGGTATPPATSLEIRPPMEEILKVLEYSPETGDSLRLRKIEKRLTSLEDLISSMKTPPAHYETPVSTATEMSEEEYKDIATVLNDYEKRISELEGKMSDLEKSISGAKTVSASLTELEISVKNNGANLKSLMSDFYSFSERVREIEKNMEVVKSQLEILKSSGTLGKIVEMENTIANFRKELTNLKDLIGDYEGMYREEEKQWMVLYADKIHTLESKFATLESTSLNSISDLREQVEGLKSDIKRLNDILSAVKVSQKIAEDVQGMAAIMEIMTVVSAISALISLSVAFYLAFFR